MTIKKEQLIILVYFKDKGKWNSSSGVSRVLFGARLIVLIRIIFNNSFFKSIVSLAIIAVIVDIANVPIIF